MNGIVWERELNRQNRLRYPISMSKDLRVFLNHKAGNRSHSKQSFSQIKDTGDVATSNEGSKLHRESSDRENVPNPIYEDKGPREQFSSKQVLDRSAKSDQTNSGLYVGQADIGPGRSTGHYAERRYEDPRYERSSVSNQRGQSTHERLRNDIDRKEGWVEERRRENRQYDTYQREECQVKTQGDGRNERARYDQHTQHADDHREDRFAPQLHTADSIKCRTEGRRQLTEDRPKTERLPLKRSPAYEERDHIEKSDSSIGHPATKFADPNLAPINDDPRQSFNLRT